MSIDQQQPPQAASRLTLCWRSLRDGYRYVNRLTHHAVGVALTLGVIAYFLFCALFLGLRYVVLPNIDNYKGNIEQVAGRALGRPVSIATIQASWSGLRPQLSLGNVVIRDKEGRQALNLPSVSATLSWWSVLAADLRLETLEIRAPDMDVRRAADGQLYVAGLLLDTSKKEGSKGLDWALSQREIVIRDGRLRWTDELRGAPALALNGVNFVVHNQWRHHQLVLKATPPAAMAAPLEVRADFVHPPFSRHISDVLLWKGELYADLRQTDLAAWKTYVDYPVEINQGQGSVRAWLNFDQAKIANFTADLRLSKVSTRLRKDLPPLRLAQVSGRISASEAFNPILDLGPTLGAHGHALSLTDFSLQTEDGLRLPPTSISEKYTPGKKGQPGKTEVKATLLDLQVLADFAARLPLSGSQLQMLADVAPRGQLKDFSAQWQGAYPEVTAYRIKGQFTGLSLKAQAPHPARPKSGTLAAQAAVPAIPGFDNLSGRIDASDHGGSFTLDSDKLVLQLPSYFTEPAMPFDQLKMQASWAFPDKDQLLFQIDKMDFVQDGLVASLSGKHQMSLKPGPDKPLGSVDLVGKASGFDLKKIGRYLPLQTPEHLRAWLTGALEDGTAQDVNIKLKGDLADFPFHTERPSDKPKGEFVVAGKIDNGKLNYSPGHFAKDGKSPFWPQAEQIKGRFVFDRTRMEIDADSAKTHGAALSNVKAVIPDLLASDSQLEIDGKAAATLQDFVRYTNDSPVAGWIDNFTEETKGSGNAKLTLKLLLPLNHMLDAKVQGSLQFMNNDVVLQNVIPPMLAANGKLEFNEKGLNLNGISANVLGGPVTVAGGTQRDGAIRIRADGSMSSEGLRKTYPMPAMQRLAQRITGGARYTVAINIKNHQPEIVVESNLQGIALDFPAPLRKAANQMMPLKVQLAGLVSDDVLTARDEIKLALGSTVAVRYLRQKTLEKDAQWRVVRGGIGVNAPAPEPDSGLVANVDMKSLDLDAWQSVASGIAAGGAEEGKEDEDSISHSIAQYVDPQVLAARAAELHVAGRKLDNVVVGASHQKKVWQANLDSDQASGYITWNESASGRGKGKVTARLVSLIIPQSAASEVSDLLEGNSAATQIPALDIVAQSFELFNKKMGRLELVANNARTPAAREWRISKLLIVNQDAELKAAGKWSSGGAGNVTSLTYALDVADAGKLLNRFGFANVLRGGKGKMDGDVSWTGLPFSLDIPSLSGQIQLDMAAGQFLKADPGAAKLLGVLSLQSLPRRLTLDFRDVFSEGFAFDGVSATATINHGVAKTDNFKMRGVSATVLLDGSADIAKESQNLHVAVIPEINAGAASVAYALAINPVIGLGTFLAQLFLREPLARAFTFEYDITGPWKDPTVTKVGSNAGTGSK